MMEELIGKTLQGYKIIQIIGKGGMGIVYRAYDTNLERYVAIKFLKSEIVDNPNLRERFKREAKNQAKLNHQNIVTVHGFLDHEGMLGIVMEFVEGTSLDKLIYSQRRLHISDSIYLIKQILSAVGFAHSKGFIHRDIKPSNIIVTKDGIAKIMDFGISKSIFENNSMTKTGAKVGTPFYMSPEQIKGINVTHLTDIYALGCTFYEMITGDPPFLGDSEYEVLDAHVKKEPPKVHLQFPDIPPFIDEIISKALKKNPAERYQNCKEFYDDIVKFEKLQNYSPSGAIYSNGEIKKKKNYLVPTFVILGIITTLIILMKFIVLQVDDFLKNKEYEKLEKYNLTNFFRSAGEYNFNKISQIPLKTKLNLTHIQFVNSNVGFAIGDSGLVLSTVDGGDNWEKLIIADSNTANIFGKNTLYSSYFFENGEGFIVGQNGTLIETNNLLQTAKKIPFLSNVTLFDIAFANRELGLIVGGKGSIFRTENGGKTWVKAKSNTQKLLYDVEFLSQKEVIAVGWNGEIIKSTDSGFSWNLLKPFTRKYIKSITFKNDHYGLACGGANNVFLTNNAGESWKEIKTKNTLTLSKIKFIDEFTVIATGNRGVVLLSKDAGETWGTVNTKFYFRLNDLTITPSNVLFIVGDNGTILKINPKNK